MTNPKTETRKEFEARWNDGIIMPSVRRGRLSIECHEDHSDYPELECSGWKMSSVESLDDDLFLYGNTSIEVAVAVVHRDELLAQDKS